MSPIYRKKPAVQKQIGLFKKEKSHLSLIVYFNRRKSSKQKESETTSFTI